MNTKENIAESFNYSYEDKFDIEDDEQRKIFINTEIDEWIIDTVVYAILRYNQIDKGKPVEERKPIYIYINSPGGSVIDGLSLVSIIKSIIANSTSKVKEQIDFELNEIGKTIKDYVISQTKIDEKLYNEKYKTEWYFMPQTAKELGVVDYIIGTDCVMDDILPNSSKANGD